MKTFSEAKALVDNPLYDTQRQQCLEGFDIRMSRVRKTHWQYIRSIKTEYLRPALIKNNNRTDWQG